MSVRDDTLKALATGFGIPVSDAMVGLAHELLDEAVSNLSAGVGDLVEQVAVITGEFADSIGDAADVLADLTEGVSDIIEFATDLVEETLGFFADIWNGIKNFFTGGSSDDARKQWKLEAFEYGMARALVLIGRASVGSVYRLRGSPEAEFMMKYSPGKPLAPVDPENSKAYIAGYYDVLRPIYATMGPAPRIVPGTLAYAWWDYLRHVGLQNTSYAEFLLHAMINDGSANQAQLEYLEVLAHISRWKQAAGLVWDRLILAKSNGGVVGPSRAFNILLAAAPGAAAVKAIF